VKLVRVALGFLIVAAPLAVGSYLFFAPTVTLAEITAQSAPTTPPMLRVMTYHVRVETQSDGDDNWPHRKEAVAALIDSHAPDVLGLQECYFGMAEDLAAMLPGYAWYARGNNDGKKGGAANPVFYRTSRLELVEKRTLWLSETPDKPSKSWGAEFPRVATLVSLREKTSGVTWQIANLHLDLEGENSQKNSALLLLRQFTSFENVIVMGDFNCEMESAACLVLTQGGLSDARIASATGHKGMNNTFNGFNKNWIREWELDHILVSSNVTVITHEIPGETVGGRMPSDHFPVIAEVLP
jgi:endonuclease/exonuclease/phosphatase family metal-dependent hydrolase